MTAFVIKAAGVVSATGDTGPIENTAKHTGIRLYLRITASSGTSPTLDVKLQSKDPATGQMADVPGAAFPQKIGANSAPETLTLFPGNVEAAAQAVSDRLPDVYQVVWTIGGTASPTFTFSIGADLFNA